jgi:hypothetical protein
MHYTTEVGREAVHDLEAGDSVYLNCEGRLIAVSLLSCVDDHCTGIVEQRVKDAYEAGERIEFDADVIYVVRKGN